MFTLAVGAALVAALQTQVVPRPTEVRARSGGFELGDRVTIVLRSDERRLRDAVDILVDALARGGVTARVRSGMGRPGDITMELPRQGAAADSEAYDVFVHRDGISLRAGSGVGMIWAVQTLRQLLPPRFEANDRRHRGRPTIASVEIHDAPRFPWRGAMIDAGRHFLDAGRVKRFLDLMSLYKLNVLHWHLTDDQGWRIDLPRYPRLTEVGAWRTEADGSRYGGFYTRAQILDVIEHARRRGIMVVPEIEMPGHSSAAIASYPFLGCTGDTIPVPPTWGVFQDIYCVGKPEVLGFLDTVVAQVAALFPAPYFHIGGDEVPKNRWQACASCQALMQREGLHNEAGLQSWFTRRMAGVLERHGKRLIGWDEITEGGLPPSVVVQVWRDMAHADSTARRGQDVIASPTSHVYLDYGQSGLTLARVYSFDPMPPGLPPDAARHILGGEGPLWSEQINDANHDLMAFPRLLALSEALWSTGQRSFAEFHARLDADQLDRLRALGVVPGPEDRDVLGIAVEADTLTGRARFRVAPAVPEVGVRYTRDGSAPTAASPAYTDSIFADSGTLDVRGFVGDAPMLAARRLVFVSHLARGRPVTLSVAPARNYPGTGPRTLTDGLLGSDDFHDGLWQGWQGADVDVTVDLQSVMDVHAVEGSFLANPESWILMPAGITAETSEDGIAWTPAGELRLPPPGADRPPNERRRLAIALPAGRRARFVRLRMLNGGPLPAWHQAAGRRSWVFADEVIVR